MHYWWVNQAQTHCHEIAGGYPWSPKRNANNARNQFYENMKIVAPGDLVSEQESDGLPSGRGLHPARCALEATRRVASNPAPPPRKGLSLASRLRARTGFPRLALGLAVTPSPNFAYLAYYDARLVAPATQAEQHFAADPTVTLFKLRQFGEVLAQRAAAKVGLYVGCRPT
jgi:hypothetical protein